MELREGLEHASSMRVTDDKTALAFGSGDVPVLATPALVALMEHAAMEAVRECLEEGETTVGEIISVRHLRPSPVGAEVEARAALTRIDGRRLHFAVEARQEEVIIGQGDHVRVIVPKERFIEKARQSLQAE